LAVEEPPAGRKEKMKASVRKINAGFQAYHWLDNGEEVTATGRTPATARKNLARELMRHTQPRKETMRAIDNMSEAEIDQLKIKGMLADRAAGKPVKTIWNSDGSEPCLICAPTHEDIQRMAGFPVDDEERALAVEDEAVKEQAEVHGAENEPYTHAEAISRWEAWGGE
jgi:hypothetical protein